MFNQQMHEIMDELREMEVCKLPYKIEEFIPLFGMFIRDFRNSKQRPPLEDIVKKHGRFEIPDTIMEIYLPIAAGYLSGWRGKNIRKNILNGKYMSYHLAACSAPLIYGLLLWRMKMTEKIEPIKPKLEELIPLWGLRKYSDRCVEKRIKHYNRFVLQPELDGDYYMAAMLVYNANLQCYYGRYTWFSKCGR